MIYPFLSFVFFLIAFIFFTIHEAISFRGFLSHLGEWWKMKNPVKMKKKFPFLPMIWNSYHCAGWLMLFFFFLSIFWAMAPYLTNYFGFFFSWGWGLALMTFIINNIFYSLFVPKKKKEEL